MKFEQLKPLFVNMEFDQQLSFITEYVERRTKELQQVPVVLDTAKAKKATKISDKQIKLNPEQLKLLKQLGLI